MKPGRFAVVDSSHAPLHRLGYRQVLDGDHRLQSGTGTLLGGGDSGISFSERGQHLENHVEWYFGRESHRKLMTGSYNETLSTTFAPKVRDTIEERPTAGGKVVYNDIFPDTRIKYGQASASLWALDGNSQDNYLATYPTGTATGFGANLILIDDVIKSAEEAYNEIIVDKHWSWFTNTMMQRTAGDEWKVIVIMTRWATNDLAGRILDSYEDVEHITYTATKPDGSMLCESILNRRDYELKTKEMNPDIVEANYKPEADRCYGPAVWRVRRLREPAGG